MSLYFPLLTPLGLRPKTSFYLLDDKFPNAASISDGDVLICEPGPGSLRYAETDGTVDKSGGTLNFTPGGSPGYTKLGWRYTPGFLRTAGRALGWKVSFDAITGSVNMISGGWGFDRFPGNFSDVRAGFAQFNAVLVIVSGASGFLSVESGALATATAYRMCVIDGDAGGKDYWIVGGGYSQWTRVWREHEQTPETTFWPTGSSNNVPSHYDEIAVFDTLFKPLNLDVVPVSNTPHNISSHEGLHDLFLTLPASPSAGDTMELRLEIDSNDYITIRVQRNVGNTQWDIFLDNVVAGTPTTLTSVTNITGVSALNLIRFRVRDNRVQMFTRHSPNNNYISRGTEQTIAAVANATVLRPVYTVGSASRMTSVVRIDDVELDRFLA